MITTSTTVITTVISITAAIIPPIIGPLSDLVVGLSFNAGVGEMSFNDEVGEMSFNDEVGEMSFNEEVGDMSFNEEVGEILIGHSLVIKTVDGVCTECGSSTIETDNMCILVYWVLISLTYLQVYEWFWSEG